MNTNLFVLVRMDSQDGKTLGIEYSLLPIYIQVIKIIQNSTSANNNEKIQNLDKNQTLLL